MTPAPLYHAYLEAPGEPITDYVIQYGRPRKLDDPTYHRYVKRPNEAHQGARGKYDY